MPSIHLGPVDWLIIVTYFAFVVGIGAVLKRGMKRSEDFFLSGRAIPAWIAGLAFLSANLGARTGFDVPPPDCRGQAFHPADARGLGRRPAACPPRA